jgi:phosphinothricin acetyltransferase
LTERVELRDAEPTDLAPLAEIYDYYIVNTSITFDLEPLGTEGRRPWFEQFERSGRHRLRVADIEVDGSRRAIGYASSHTFRPKGAYQTSVEASIYLHPDWTGRGIGARLYSDLFNILGGEDVHRVYAGITLPNDASVALHKRFGFEKVGLFQEVGRKLGRFWDVAWFEKRLTSQRSKDGRRRTPDLAARRRRAQPSPLPARRCGRVRAQREPPRCLAQSPRRISSSVYGRRCARFHRALQGGGRAFSSARDRARRQGHLRNRIGAERQALPALRPLWDLRLFR